MPGPAGILFDVGYCLMDESARLAHALGWLARALGSAGHPRSAAALHAAYREACRRPEPGEPSLLAQMLRSLEVPGGTTATLRRGVPWDVVPLEPYPETVSALRDLRAAGFRLGVLANQPASARAELDRAGIAALCDGIWLSAAVGLAKPDPAFFRLALDAWALAPGRVAYVGDRPDNDVVPAKILGLATVRLRRGPHADQAARTDAERADVDARDLTETARHLIAWRAALGGG
ncbi:MAG TPA: HAD family hydrolase [Methylomirabilota bacterium]|nr:HAD family hydrolase [Methylomirabilota bacterium]